MDDALDEVLGVLSNAANAAIAAKYQHPFELQKLQLEAMANGRYYPEGYPVGGAPVGIPSGVLLIAAGVVAWLVLKD